MQMLACSFFVGEISPEQRRCSSLPGLSHLWAPRRNARCSSQSPWGPASAGRRTFVLGHHLFPPTNVWKSPIKFHKRSPNSMKYKQMQENKSSRRWVFHTRKSDLMGVCDHPACQVSLRESLLTGPFPPCESIHLSAYTHPCTFSTHSKPLKTKNPFFNT